MPQTVEELDQEVIKEAILDAAQSRLLKFGYSKTTMSEIAGDVDMSAANLYRYFKNKQDIVAECTSRCLDERLQNLRLIVDDKSATPAEKLERYALELVENSHALAGGESMVGELVDIITLQRPSVLHSKNEIQCALISEILEEGNQSGDFTVQDTANTARHIFSAFAMFDVPLFIGFYDREEFDRRARGVVALLIDGLHG